MPLSKRGGSISIDINSILNSLYAIEFTYQEIASMNFTEWLDITDKIRLIVRHMKLSHDPTSSDIRDYIAVIDNTREIVSAFKTVSEVQHNYITELQKVVSRTHTAGSNKEDRQKNSSMACERHKMDLDDYKQIFFKEYDGETGDVCFVNLNKLLRATQSRLSIAYSIHSRLEAKHHSVVMQHSALKTEGEKVRYGRR